MTTVAGVTEIELSVASLTFNCVEPKIEPNLAELTALTVTVPWPAAVTTPFESIDAADGFDNGFNTDHVIELVRSCVVVSLNVPIATKLSSVGGAIVAFDGVSAIDCNVAPVTVRLVEAFIVPTEAETVVPPTSFAVTSLVVVLLVPKVAMVGSENVHWARLVTSRVLPSVKVPSTEKSNFVRFAIEGFAGRTTMETRFERSTVRAGGGLCEKLDSEPKDACTVDVPRLLPIASPLFEVMNGPDPWNDQSARFVTSCVVPSLKVAVAANCC